MRIHSLLLCTIVIQGGECLKYFLQKQKLACLFDYSNQQPTQLHNKSCIAVDSNSVTDSIYLITQGNVLDLYDPYSTFTLKETRLPQILCRMGAKNTFRTPSRTTNSGSFIVFGGLPHGDKLLDRIVTGDETWVKTQNSRLHIALQPTSETINTYRYTTSLLIESFSLDWIHNEVYILLDIILSAPMTKTEQVIPLNIFLTRDDIASAIGLQNRFMNIEEVQIDPYRKFVYILVDDGIYIRLIRSNLSGKELKQVISRSQRSDNWSLFVDINEMRLFLPINDTLYIYNYEGDLLKEVHLTHSVMDFAVFENSVYLTSPQADGLVEVNLNQSQSHLAVTRVYRHDLNGHCSVGILDARVKRRKEHGKYICDRTDCPELCEVEPSGDTCVCLHTKAKTRDGVMCYSCGQSNLTSLLQQPTIVNGQVSNPSNFPWQAAIYKTTDLEQICGGTLISSQVVLTAAHCVTLHCVVCTPSVMKPEVLKVALGKTQRSWNITGPYDVRRNVSKLLVEDGYMGVSTNYVNDIALLFLDSKVSINSHVMPACLDYNFNQLPPYDTLIGYVSGFGFTKDCGRACSNYSDTLLYTTGTALNLSDCLSALNAKDFSSFHTLTTDKFCVGNGTVSAVQNGDSGGGFTVVFKGLHYVTGVVSAKLIKYDKNFKLKYSFGGFTNISMHMDWIKQNIIE